MGALARCFPAIFIFALSACGKPAVGRELLVVDVTRAPIPVMMSQVKREPRPGTAPRRAIDPPEPLGADGLPESASTPGSDTIYTYEEGRTTLRSRLGASDQLLRQITADTGWVAVRATVFSASDTAYLSGDSKTHRELSLQATGRR